MKHFYSVRDGDNFYPNDYPLVAKELSWIRSDLKPITSLSTGEIIISFYKNHSLKSEWLLTHPALTGLITSRHFTATHLESLFDACRSNKLFCWTLEQHIGTMFLPESVNE